MLLGSLGRGHSIFEDPLERFQGCVLAGSACVCKEAVGDEVGESESVRADREPPGQTCHGFWSARSRRRGTLRSVSVGEGVVRILFWSNCCGRWVEKEFKVGLYWRHGELSPDCHDQS